MMVIQQKRYTAEEFYAFLSQLAPDKRYELIEGVIVEMAPSSPLCSIIAGTILRLLGNYVAEHDLGYVMGADGGYTLSPGNVRIPDVSFIHKDRMPHPLPQNLAIPPDLVVEVISPSERPGEIRQKIDQYLQAEVRLVWVVYPDEQMVDVWQTANDGRVYVQSLTHEDMLTGDAVLPDFTLPVTKIFST